MINVCKRWVGIFISVMYKVAHSSIHLSHDFHIQFPSQLLCLGCRSRRAQGGCPSPHQILSDQLILSQPGGERLCPTHYYIPTCPQNFHTFLRPCLQFFLSLSLLSRALSWNDDHICNYVWLVTKWHRNLKESSRNFLGSLWRKEDNNNNNYYCM